LLFPPKTETQEQNLEHVSMSDPHPPQESYGVDEYIAQVTKTGSRDVKWSRFFEKERLGSNINAYEHY
jgi:hypothetical protein